MAFETYTVQSNIQDTWAEFKKYLDGTYATLAFTFNESTDFYTIITETYSGVAQRYELLKDAGADQTDFETNFKTLPLRLENSKAAMAVYGYDADGSAPTKPPVLIAGFDGTNVQQLRTASDGTVRIDPTGTTTQPVSGTVTANAGTGTFNVTGTGTAGTPASGVVTIQGIVGGTAVPISGSITATNPSVGTNNSAIPTSSTQIGGSDGTNLQAARVFDLDSGAGSEYVIGVGLRKIANGGSVELGTSSDPIRIDPTGTTTQPVSGTVTANAGTGNFNTNLVQYGGSNVGAGNAIHVQPGTSATFTVVQATASNLNAAVVGIGVAGTPSGGVLSIQGVSGGTAVPISGTVTANNASVGSNNSAIPTSSTQIGGSDGTNLQAARVYDVNSGAGSEYVLGMSLRKTTSTGSVEFGTTTNPLVIDLPKYQKSAFDALRVAQNYTLADLINKYEIDSKEYSTSTATGGTVTHVPAQSAIQLTVTGTNGSQAQLRTNTFYRYQAGKGLRIKQTVYHADTGQTNQVRRWGFFDENDGVFWELSGTSFRVVRRTSISGSAVDTAVASGSFSNDSLNGSGPSGITLDITKGNIFEINLQWLGVGTVNFYVNGNLVHQILNANTIAGPYMRTAQLPAAFQVINTGASTGSSMTSICSSVIAEGGESPPEYSYCAFNSSFITVTTTARPILTIRPKATYNSITNRMILIPKLMSIATEGARIGYRLVYNATLTGASYSSVSSGSGTEFDVAATALSGGETLYYGFLANSNDSDQIYIDKLFNIVSRVLRQNAFATSVDTLTISAVNEAAGSTSVKGSLTWGEIR